MRISDWSSDVCSSDLPAKILPEQPAQRVEPDMPVGRHRDMARLEPEPFAVVDPHPVVIDGIAKDRCGKSALAACERPGCRHGRRVLMSLIDRKSTRLNSSH